MNVDVVTSCFNDEAELDYWESDVRQSLDDQGVYADWFFFRKGGGVPFLQREQDGKFIQIANYGKCEYAFLLHILDRYDTLADQTVFSKANLRLESIPILDLIRGFQHFDFSETGHRLKYRIFHPDREGEEPDTPLLCIEEDTERVYKAKHVYAESTNDWIDQLYPGRTLNNNVGFGGGPCMSVSKELIRSHPVETYQFLINKYLPESGSWDIEEGYKYYPTIEEQIKDVGAHYHDCYIRLWRALWTSEIPNATVGLFPKTQV